MVFVLETNVVLATCCKVLQCGVLRCALLGLGIILIHVNLDKVPLWPKGVRHKVADEKEFVYAGYNGLCKIFCGNDAGGSNLQLSWNVLCHLKHPVTALP